MGTIIEKATAEIIEGMARAFFASAYADQAEETGQPLAGEIMDQLPGELDPAAVNAARVLAIDLVRANYDSVSDSHLAHLWRVVDTAEKQHADRECTPELFGHYCAMQAMGHGVGLECFGVPHDIINVPYIEFGSYSLARDYFTETDAE